MLTTICDELGVSYPRGEVSGKALADILNQHLLGSFRSGRRTVVIIDEAQDLGAAVLEQVRLLTNLETSKHKLLQIFLVGQPELKRLLARTELRQVAQRITARYHLTPLGPMETHEYIRHRLQVAGVRRRLFSDGAQRRVHRLSGGVPRIINILCDRALLGAYSRDAASIDAATVRRAAREVSDGALRWHWLRSPATYAAVAGLVGIVVGFVLFALLEHVAPGHARGEAARSAAPSLPSQPIAAGAGGSGLETRPQMAPPSRRAVAAQSSLPLRRLPVSVAVTAEGAGVESPPIAAPPPLDELLADATLRSSTREGFDRLLSYWQIDSTEVPREASEICDWLSDRGLRCWFRRGSLEDLRALNRPAIVELMDAGGMRHHLVVTGVEAGRVWFDLGNRTASFDLVEVLRRWNGGFIVVWQPPLPAVDGIYPWTRGEAIVWLRERLAEIRGVPLRLPASDVYDDELKAQVLAFQRAHNLEQDGIVGPQTFIQLNTVLSDAHTPLLTPAVDG